MADEQLAVETPHSHEEHDKPDCAAIIRRRTGKDRLTATSLRSIAVATLKEVAEECHLDNHKHLKKADLIQALLRMLEQDTIALKVEPRTESAGLSQEPDPEDDRQAEPEQDQRGDQVEEPEVDDIVEVLEDVNGNQDCPALLQDPHGVEEPQGIEEPACQPLNDSQEGGEAAHTPDRAEHNHITDMTVDAVIDDDAIDHAAEKQGTHAAQPYVKVENSEEAEHTEAVEEEEEEYDEDPYLGDEPSEIQEDSGAEDDQHSKREQDHEQEEPQNEATDGDARDPTAEAHKKAEEDQHASPSNRSEDGGSEHITAPPETKGRSSVSGSESGKRLPERRRSGQQAPIVWQPAANRPNSLFDRHQQQLDALDPMHAQKQDFGGAVGNYDGRRLVVSIPSEYAIGLRRPSIGKPKRQIQFAAGQFQLKGCPELPHEEDRQPLQLAKSSKRNSSGRHRSAPKWNRRVSFNAKLLPGEKVEYVRHGDCITVKLMNLPANFWYSSTVSRRFAIDPAEFDAEYQAGVAKVEKGISANPELWKTNWINQNISRIVRAKAIRSFLSNSKAHINPTTYYRHFQSLCKGIQKLHPPISHDESEKAYELGCARTVGCATAVTFKMLTALPKDTIGDIMRALGMELCTPEFISGKEAVDDRLYALIKAHCPPHLFWKIICCKAGPPPQQRVKTEAAAPIDQVNQPHPGRQPEKQRGFEPAADSARPDYRTRQTPNESTAGHGIDRYDRGSCRKPVRDARKHERTHSATRQRADRWSDPAVVRDTGRDRSRPHSPVPSKPVTQDPDRAVAARSHSRQKGQSTSTYAERRTGDEAGWVHGARESAPPVSRDRKGWENISSHDRNKRQADPPVVERGPRGMISDLPRRKMDSVPAQTFPEPPRKVSTFRPEADRSERHLQPMQRSGRHSQGGFVHSQDRHDAVRVSVPARGDQLVHRGVPEDSAHLGGGQKRGVHAPIVSRVPVTTLRGAELGSMQGRVAVSDVRHMSPSRGDLQTDPQGFTMRRQPDTLLRQESSDVFSHDLLPTRMRQREVMHVDDARLPLPPSIDSRSMVTQRAHMPGPMLVPANRRLPIHSTVQQPAPAVQSYDANQFQAAVAQAVQEVVKRLGVPVPGALPDAAAAAALHAAPRAGGRTVHASVPGANHGMLPGRQSEQHYSANPRSSLVGTGVQHGYVAHESSYAAEDFRPSARHGTQRHSAHDYGKRPRDVTDEDMSVVTPRYDSGSRAMKARRLDLPQAHRTDRSNAVVDEQPTRYPDVEIIPEVSIVSHQNDYEYPEPSSFQREQPQRSAGRRFQNDEPQRGAGRRFQHDQPQRDVVRNLQHEEPPRGAGRSSQQDKPQHGGGCSSQHDQPHRSSGRNFQHDEAQHGAGRRHGGNMRQPQAARASATQRTASASVGGFLNNRSGQNDGRGGSNPAERQDHPASPAGRPVRAVQPGSPGKPHAVLADDVDPGRRSSRWSNACKKEEAADRMPTRQEQYTNDTDLRAGAPVRQNSAQEPTRHMQQHDFQQHRGRMQQNSVQQSGQRHAQSESAWHGRYGSEPDTGAARTSDAGGLTSVSPHDIYMDHSAASGMNVQHDVMANSASHVSCMHDGMLMQSPSAAEVTPRMGANKSVIASALYETASVAASSKPATKLRSGGSRVASSARTVEGGDVRTAENEDAFAVGSCCFAVGDGMEQVDASGVVVNSGVYTHELVSAAVSIAADSVRGRDSGPVDPKMVLQQATSATQASGAAAIMLGSLNPLTSVLSVAKMGDVGFLVLRPGASLSTTGDLEPSDIIVAATDGFFDAVHIFGQPGLATRQLIRSLYLGEQLDPGQLAERLLLRAWGAVQEARSSSIIERVPPFMQEVYQTRQQRRFPIMPEDDIAVVVSYVLQA